MSSVTGQGMYRVLIANSLADMAARLMPVRNSSLNSARLFFAPSSVSSQLFAMWIISALGSISSKATTERYSRRRRWPRKRQSS